MQFENLNRIVTMYLDYAEDQAKQHIPMYMNDWKQRLDAFLQFTGRRVLDNAGTITRKKADEFAIEQYEIFNLHRNSLNAIESTEFDMLPVLPSKATIQKE